MAIFNFFNTCATVLYYKYEYTYTYNYDDAGGDNNNNKNNNDNSYLPEYRVFLYFFAIVDK